MNTLENNKLIAEFMGLKPHGNYFEIEDETLMEITSIEKGEVTSLGYIFEVDGLKYHTSWDWLMSVIKKIGELEASDSEVTEHLSDNGDLTTSTMGGVTVTPIIRVAYQEVVEFIIWYKKDK